MKIVIINYNMGNLRSIYNAFKQLNEQCTISNKKEEILNADLIILPGVGAFNEAMKKLEEYNLIEILKKAIEKNISIFGICLGMQLLFEKSHEFKETKGLGFLKGEIKKLNARKLPNINWHNLQIQKESKLLKEINENDFFYFIHSFAIINPNEEYTIATSEYENNIFGAVIQKNNIFACQFHPEKSGEKGLVLLKNLLNKVKNVK